VKPEIKRRIIQHTVTPYKSFPDLCTPKRTLKSTLNPRVMKDASASRAQPKRCEEVVVGQVLEELSATVLETRGGTDLVAKGASCDIARHDDARKKRRLWDILLVRRNIVLGKLVLRSLEDTHVEV
jgi:hypothetical protein